MRLKGKVAVVTGSSRGIGRAVALGYAREGARVALNFAPSGEGGELEGGWREGAQTLEALRAIGADAILVRADVSQPDEVSHLFDKTHRTLGKVDILVNNAGISLPAPWTATDVGAWDRVLEVNLRGAFLCSRAATADMIEQGYGKIINVSSIVFQLGVHEGLASYLASKAGLVGLTRALARELGPYNIQVNAIAPGAIQTERELELYPDQEALADYLYERQCLKRRGTPEDLLGAFLFLASHDSDFVTGQLLNVDGGWAMH